MEIGLRRFEFGRVGHFLSQFGAGPGGRARRGDGALQHLPRRAAIPATSRDPRLADQGADMVRRRLQGPVVPMLGVIEPVRAKKFVGQAHSQPCILGRSRDGLFVKRDEFVAVQPAALGLGIGDNRLRRFGEPPEQTLRFPLRLVRPAEIAQRQDQFTLDRDFRRRQRGGAPEKFDGRVEPALPPRQQTAPSPTGNDV